MLVLGEKKFQLGEFALEPTKRELTRGHQAIHLASRPFQVLIYLIEHHGQLVARGELLDRFWDGKDVYDEALTKCVGAIRKALDDREERFIETRYSEGYRYVGPLQVQVSSAPGVAEEIERIRGVRVVLEEEDILEVAEASNVQIGRFPSGVRNARTGRSIMMKRARWNSKSGKGIFSGLHNARKNARRFSRDLRTDSGDGAAALHDGGKRR